MVDLLLIYPYFNDDYSILKFPPLGLGYIASYLKNRGYTVDILDATFMREREVLSKALDRNPTIIGIYCMWGMQEFAFRLAEKLRENCELRITGGPLPTYYPKGFLDNFDVVVIGEGERTVLEILKTHLKGDGLSKVRGIAYKDDTSKSMIKTPSREQIQDLNALPFPSRELFDHEGYKSYFEKHHGYTITSMITSRGCPFECDFCSRPVFGRSCRNRSPDNIVNEIEDILSYGYDRIWFSDDIFPVSRKMGMSFFREIKERKLDISWECLCRADIMDKELAEKMKETGCCRVFFGLESGNNAVLKKMNKHLTIDQSKKAVETVNEVGIKAGAFFIIGYPGETDKTMLDTIKFASSLSLDYLSFTVPYPLPGTGLYEKVKDRMKDVKIEKPKYHAIKHKFVYESEFSLNKLRFGIIKAKLQKEINKHLDPNQKWLRKPFEYVTDKVFRFMK